MHRACIRADRVGLALPLVLVFTLGVRYGDRVGEALGDRRKSSLLGRTQALAIGVKACEVLWRRGGQGPLDEVDRLGILLLPPKGG